MSFGMASGTLLVNLVSSDNKILEWTFHRERSTYLVQPFEFFVLEFLGSVDFFEHCEKWPTHQSSGNVDGSDHECEFSDRFFIGFH